VATVLRPPEKPGILARLFDRGAAGGERRSGEDRRSGHAEERPARDQIFQEPIQSISLAPDGFMPCRVETTSTGSMVTKS